MKCETPYLAGHPDSSPDDDIGRLIYQTSSKEPRSIVMKEKSGKVSSNMTIIFYYLIINVTPMFRYCKFQSAESLKELRDVIKEENVMHGRRYLYQPLNASELRVEFSKRQCCNGNCMENLIKMPRDSTVQGCCPLHMPTYCEEVNNSSVVKDVDAFERLISHARFATEKYRSNTSEANKALRAFLVHKLKSGRTVSGTMNNWNYTVVVPEYRNPIPVCMKAFSAIYGIKKSTLKDVQKKIRKDEVYNQVVGIDEDLTLEQAFAAWGMDIAFYHSNIF